MGRAREDDGISRFAEDSPGLCLLLWYDYCVFPSQKHPSWNNNFTVILGRKSVLGTVRAVPWLWGRCEAVWCGWLASKTEVSMPNSEPGPCPTDTGEALRPLFLTPEILSM